MSDTVTRTINDTVLPSPGTWAFDAAHSHIEFSVRHMMVGKTRGRFGSFNGTITVADEPSESTVEVAIDAASIDTRDPRRDEHLSSPDFLDVERYPQLTFESTSVRGWGTEWAVTGDLTVHGVTRPVTVELELEGVVEKDPFGLARVAFSGSTEIDREDFGLTWNAALDTGGVLVGKRITITFEIEAVRPLS